VGKKISALSVLLLLLVCFGGCGGSGQSSSEVPVAVSISDQPSNVGVLSFDIQITSACLLTSANAFATDCSGAQSLLPDLPMTVQLENMQTSQQSDVLATTSVAPGTYTGCPDYVRDCHGSGQRRSELDRQGYSNASQLVHSGSDARGM